MSAPDWRGIASTEAEAAEDAADLDRDVSVARAGDARRLLGRLLRPHAALVAMATVLVVAQNMAMLSGPLLIAFAVDSGIPALRQGDPGPLVRASAGMAGVAVAEGVLYAGFVRAAARLGQEVLLDLRQRLFTHSQQLSLSFHDRYTSGRMISRQTSDLDSLGELLESALDGLVSSLLSLVGLAALMLLLDLPLSGVVAVGLIPLLVLTRWFRRRARGTYRRTRTEIALAIVQLTDTLGGIRAVQAYQRQHRNMTLMSAVSRRFAAALTDSFRVLGHFVSGVRGIGNVTLAVVLVYGGYRVLHGHMELGALTAFLLYLRRFYEPLDELAIFANDYTAASAALEKVAVVLNETPEVAEPSRPVEPRRPARGRVHFRDTSFRYLPDSPLVLRPTELVIPEGQTVALVGATGAGKSTLAKLLARFYDPSTGSVALDGVDLRHLTDAQLRERVIMVTQEAFLFTGTVAENIGLGDPAAGRQQVEQAAARVGAHRMITQLPQGYDTDVRKRGGRLSAGQRQLIGFARAVLADPAVVVLDEATSSMDLPTERIVQSALETVLAGRTALIIAHRLSTVLIADRVLLIRDGVVTEDAPPQQLLAAGGEFAELHRAWSRR